MAIIHRYDAIIVGAGGAGLRAALGSLSAFAACGRHQ